MLVVGGDRPCPEGQAAGVGSQQNIDLIDGDQTFRQDTTLRGIARIVIIDQAYRKDLLSYLDATTAVGILDPCLDADTCLLPLRSVSTTEGYGHANMDMVGEVTHGTFSPGYDG